MGIHVISMCAILAIIPLYWLPVLPDLHIVWLLIAAGIALSVQQRKWLRFSGLALLFMCWGILAAQESVWPMNYLTQAPQQAEVVITATDGATMHQGRIVSLNGERVWAAMGVALYGNYLPQNVCVGQRWAMTLRLRAVHGELNDGGYDSQKNAFARHQTLSGRFTHAALVDEGCSLRAQYLTSLQNTLSAYQWGPVILGLGMGERLSVSREIKNLMRDTGTMHLMAISGLHIALAASVIWFLARGIQFFLPGRWIIWQIPLLAGLIFAAFYAWLTGLQPPALRTVIALVVLAALKMSGPVVALAGMAYLRGGDPDFRPTGGTVTKPGVVSVCGRRAYFLVSVVASPALATWPVPAAAGYAVVFAGRNAAASVAASGPDFPWFQPLLAGGEPVCRSSGHVYLSSADPARHVSASVSGRCAGKYRLAGY